MPVDEERRSAERRNAGVRKIRQITWRAGAAGVICSAVIAVAFGQHAEAGQAKPPGSDQGTILVPGQPPSPATGAGHVTSGAS